MDTFYESCGYLATFMGTLLEGELSMLTAVLGAKLGYFSYSGALVAGFGGAYVADWFKFIVAKKKGLQLLAKKPKLKAKIDKSTEWFEKNPYLILTVYKMFFGFTTVVLIMAGIKNISYLRYGIHSAISVGIWVSILGGFGFFCAEEMMDRISYVSDHKFTILGVLSLVILFFWYFVKRPYQKYCMECR